MILEIYDIFYETMASAEFVRLEKEVIKIDIFLKCSFLLKRKINVAKWFSITKFIVIFFPFLIETIIEDLGKNQRKNERLILKNPYNQS